MSNCGLSYPFPNRRMENDGICEFDIEKYNIEEDWIEYMLDIYSANPKSAEYRSMAFSYLNIKYSVRTSAETNYYCFDMFTERRQFSNDLENHVTVFGRKRNALRDILFDALRSLDLGDIVLSYFS